MQKLERARRRLRIVDDPDVEEASHMDHLRGAMATFPNLHEVNEAYHRLKKAYEQADGDE
ncbi:hypothetical protein QA599_04790 [Haloarculaceae archaeon H-GB1-1]|nr:hypothetical protein [Haloarculaceae archaeon H-GB1-1]